jgi:hypothetical protein
MPIPAPALSETLEEVPLSRKLVAAGTVGPMIWMLEAPVERVILFPAENTIVPVEDAKVPAETALRPEMEMLDAPEAREMLGPSTRLTLEEEAFRLKLVATGTVGPTMVIDDAPVFRVMFAPAAKMIVPVEVAAAVPMAATAAAPGVGPTMVIELAPLLKVMFAPATSETLAVVPFRVNVPPPPPAPPEIVIVLPDEDRVMLLPATSTSGGWLMIIE